jgi:hypothetical protein
VNSVGIIVFHVEAAWNNQQFTKRYHISVDKSWFCKK